MASIEQSIEVNVPVRTAYNQWTQFEEFPRFMEGVESVAQLDDKRLHWRANIGGKTKEWVAEITEQRPDERIAWTSRGGVFNAGVVTFHRLDDARAKIMLQVDYDPEGVVENVGDVVGSFRRGSRGICSASRSSSSCVRVRRARGGARSSGGKCSSEIASPDSRPVLPYSFEPPAGERGRTRLSNSCAHRSKGDGVDTAELRVEAGRPGSGVRELPNLA
jgi:ribosome-associated toxin RatA of RatAB toxin-antitoxin module